MPMHVSGAVRATRARKPLEPDGARSTAGALGDWARLVVATSSRIVLLAMLGALLWTAAPAALGWKPTTVMSDSMAPRIRAGDVVVAMPSEEAVILAGLGKVILFDDPDHEGRLRLHRLIDVTEDALLVTRGDANPDADSSPSPVEAVHGVAMLRAPLIGLPILWFSEGSFLLVGAAAVAIVGLIALAGADGHLRRRTGVRSDPDAVAGDRTGAEPSDHPVGRSLGSRRVPVVVGAISALAVALLTVGHGSDAAFARTTSSPSSSFSAQNTFDCFTGTAPDNPYFYYRFSEQSGTATTDSSGNGRNGILQSAVTRTPGGCSGESPSVTLSGSATAGSITPSGGAVTGPATYSIEAWFKTTSVTGGKIVGFGSAESGLSTNYDRHLYLTNSGQVVFGARGLTNNTVASAAGLNDGQWHHVVATMDNGILGIGPGMRLYVDRSLVGSNSNTASQSGSGYWRIGFDNLSGWASAPTSQAFTGSLDNVAVYTSALTAARVSAHYALGH